MPARFNGLPDILVNRFIIFGRVNDRRIVIGDRTRSFIESCWTAGFECGVRGFKWSQIHGETGDKFSKLFVAPPKSR